MRQKGFAPILVIILIVLICIAGFFLFIRAKNNSKCAICTKDNESKVCDGGTSCFIINEEAGVCVPIPKTGQIYSISQINSICGTNYPEK